VKRRTTPAQRRAGQRLKAIALSLRPPRDAAGLRPAAEVSAPALATLAADGDVSDRPRLELPEALTKADALPVLPVVELGRRLADAIKRLDARVPLDLLAKRYSAIEPGDRRA
jgi:hypothetical protein